MYRKVLLTTDGSPTATQATAIGAALAKAAGAEILVLHVGDADQGSTVLAAAREALGDVATMTSTGDPVDVIVDVAGTENVDLIVVGNKGMTGARRILGSVPNGVSHHAPCDVLIAKTT